MYVKIVVATVFLIASSFSFGQTSFALIDGSGKTIGWLMDKEGAYLRAITPGGLIVTMIADTGVLTTLDFNMPAELLYESIDCSGQAYIERLGLNKYPAMEVFPLASDVSSWVVAAGSSEVINLTRTIRSSKDKNADCLALQVEQEMAVNLASEIDPAQLGFERAPTGTRWDVISPLTMKVERSEIISCNGFESCPTVEGPRGYTSLIKQTSLGIGDVVCDAGGVKIQSGIDTSEDGVLDDDEITDTNYVCNGFSP